MQRPSSSSALLPQRLLRMIVKLNVTDVKMGSTPTPLTLPQPMARLPHGPLQWCPAGSHSTPPRSAHCQQALVFTVFVSSATKPLRTAGSPAKMIFVLAGSGSYGSAGPILANGGCPVSGSHPPGGIVPMICTILSTEDTSVSGVTSAITERSQAMSVDLTSIISVRWRATVSWF
jgi:hypothetical protein